METMIPLHYPTAAVSVPPCTNVPFPLIQALNDVVQLKKRYKLNWVPKSITRKCAEVECRKVFQDGFTQHHCRCCGRVFCCQCSIQRVPVPAYGYETPVRVCKHCYGLLNEEVLCDFDESDIDIDQWNCVHLQNVANADNIGRKPNKFLRAFSSSGRTRTGTVTSSGYTSSTTSPNDVEDDDGGGGESGGEEEDPAIDSLSDAV
eukprot:sb/3470518/